MKAALVSVLLMHNPRCFKMSPKVVLKVKISCKHITVVKVNVIYTYSN